MPQNVEIKARLSPGDLTRVRERAASLAGAAAEHLWQRDSFFHVETGRLKLRELGDGSAELIYYERPDDPGAKLSSYAIAPCAPAAAMREVLGRALGVRGIVEKQRVLYRVGRTRVHVDEVRGLGPWLELEVVLEPGEPAESGRRVAEKLLDALEIGRDQLVAGAYLDLLEAAAEA